MGIYTSRFLSCQIYIHFIDAGDYRYSSLYKVQNRLKKKNKKKQIISQITIFLLHLFGNVTCLYTKATSYAIYYFFKALHHKYYKLFKNTLIQFMKY